MRYNLVTHFRCAKCGTQLLIATEHKPAPYDPEASDGITGADKVEQVISIYPCKKCYSEAARPLSLLREALEIAGKGETK